jgi:hypothetical protein
MPQPVRRLDQPLYFDDDVFVQNPDFAKCLGRIVTAANRVEQSTALLVIALSQDEPYEILRTFFDIKNYRSRHQKIREIAISDDAIYNASEIENMLRRSESALRRRNFIVHAHWGYDPLDKNSLYRGKPFDSSASMIGFFPAPPNGAVGGGLYNNPLKRWTINDFHNVYQTLDQSATEIFCKSVELQSKKKTVA